MAILGHLRGWSRTLMAGLIVLGLMIPTLDAFRCVAEFGDATISSTVKHESKTIIAKDISGKPLSPIGGADPLCPHGHCQHPAGIPSVAAPAVMPVTMAYFEPFQAAYSVPHSLPPPSLLRPPRA